MTNDIKLSQVGTLSLTDQELKFLDDLLLAGDRGAFHYVYATIADVDDARLTAKISTFSDTVGGIAFAANWYGQTLYDPNSPYWLGEGETYPGIYRQSQNVAARQLEAIQLR